MRDADTCSMGPSEEPCTHGTRSSRYCPLCDTSKWTIKGSTPPPPLLCTPCYYTNCEGCDGGTCTCPCRTAHA